MNTHLFDDIYENIYEQRLNLGWNQLLKEHSLDSLPIRDYIFSDFSFVSSTFSKLTEASWLDLQRLYVETYTDSQFDESAWTLQEQLVVISEQIKYEESLLTTVVNITALISVLLLTIILIYYLLRTGLPN